MAKKTPGAEDDVPLTDDRLALYQSWSPDNLQFNDRSVFRVQFDRCAAGKINMFVTAEWGVGKTRAVLGEMRRLEQEWDQEQDPDAPTLRYFEASAAEGNKTILMDLATELTGRSDLAALNRTSAAHVRDLVFRTLVRRRIQLLVVDEASLLNDHNLMLLWQLWDRAQIKGHTFGLCLVGTPELADALERLGQAGHRFGVGLSFKRLTQSEHEKVLRSSHPGFERLAEVLPAGEWRQLSQDMFMRTGGRQGPLYNVLKEVHHWALEFRLEVNPRLVAVGLHNLAGNKGA